MWQAFWGEEAPTESNDSMNLAVTEGFIKAASQAVKEELLQEWQSFRADLFRDLTHLIHAEVAKVSLGRRPRHSAVAQLNTGGGNSREVGQTCCKPGRKCEWGKHGYCQPGARDGRGIDFPCTPRRHHKAQVKPSSCGSAEAASVKDKEENQDASNSETQVEAAVNPSSSLLERQQRRRLRFTATAWTWMTRKLWQRRAHLQFLLSRCGVPYRRWAASLHSHGRWPAVESVIMEVLGWLPAVEILSGRSILRNFVDSKALVQHLWVTADVAQPLELVLSASESALERRSCLHILDRLSSVFFREEPWLMVQLALDNALMMSRGDFFDFATYSQAGRATVRLDHAFAGLVARIFYTELLLLLRNFAEPVRQHVSGQRYSHRTRFQVCCSSLRTHIHEHLIFVRSSSGSSAVGHSDERQVSANSSRPPPGLQDVRPSSGSEAEVPQLRYELEAAEESAQRFQETAEAAQAERASAKRMEKAEVWQLRDALQAERASAKLLEEAAEAAEALARHRLPEQGPGALDSSVSAWRAIRTLMCCER
eukprot:s3386_g4.t3